MKFSAQPEIPGLARFGPELAGPSGSDSKGTTILTDLSISGSGKAGPPLPRPGRPDHGPIFGQVGTGPGPARAPRGRNRAVREGRGGWSGLDRAAHAGQRVRGAVTFV